MSHILRAHQLCMEGYASLFDKHLSTVWSAPNYCYRCGNQASILEVGPGGSMYFNVFEAAPENERDGPLHQAAQNAGGKARRLVFRLRSLFLLTHVSFRPAVARVLPVRIGSHVILARPYAPCIGIFHVTVCNISEMFIRGDVHSQIPSLSYRSNYTCTPALGTTETTSIWSKCGKYSKPISTMSLRREAKETHSVL